MSVHDDLATLRLGLVENTDDPLGGEHCGECGGRLPDGHRAHCRSKESFAAHARVEARVQELGRERDEWKRWSTRQGANKRAEAAEAALADMRTTVARQLTPLDVAITHVQIVRNKQGEYTDEERDNVLSITESHAKEVRDALFAALATADSGPKEGTKWGPDHPSYDEMGQ